MLACERRKGVTTHGFILSGQIRDLQALKQTSKQKNKMWAGESCKDLHITIPPGNLKLEGDPSHTYNFAEWNINTLFFVKVRTFLLKVFSKLLKTVKEEALYTWRWSLTFCGDFNLFKACWTNPKLYWCQSKVSAVILAILARTRDI